MIRAKAYREFQLRKPSLAPFWALLLSAGKTKSLLCARKAFPEIRP